MKTNNYLIKGETFTLNDKVEVFQNIPSDEEINEKYNKGEIRIVTEQARYPLDNIETMLDSKKYILNPEYQRRKRWDNIRKSRLIESFIMNVPIPPIFLYEIDYSIYEVMDGQQRLTALYDFYKGNFALDGLEYWQELNGRKYKNLLEGKQFKTLPEQIKKGIDRRYLSSIVLLQETAKSKEEAEFLKQIVFERLNSGGEKLTPQETRNALNNGKFNQLCIKIAQNDFFRKMWELPLESDGEEKLLESESYRKMEDVELVLRFFAYRHIDKFTYQIDRFLDSFLKQANKFPDETLINLEKIFTETVELIYEIFGDSAFKLPKDKKRAYKRPVKTIYDPMMQVFATNLHNRNKLKQNMNEIKQNLYMEKSKLNNNHVYLFETRNNNRADVENRIKYFHDFLQTYTK